LSAGVSESDPNNLRSLRLDCLEQGELLILGHQNRARAVGVAPDRPVVGVGETAIEDVLGLVAAADQPARQSRGN